MKQTGLPDWRPLIRYPERKMYFAECRMRNAEFWKSIFCEILSAKRSANYTLEFFRIPQNSNKIK